MPVFGKCSYKDRVKRHRIRWLELMGPQVSFWKPLFQSIFNCWTPQVGSLPPPGENFLLCNGETCKISFQSLTRWVLLLLLLFLFSIPPKWVFQKPINTLRPVHVRRCLLSLEVNSSSCQRERPQVVQGCMWQPSRRLRTHPGDSLV